MEIDINVELANDAALEYSEDKDAQKWFALGWLAFCDGANENDGPVVQDFDIQSHWSAGYNAACDTPD